MKSFHFVFVTLGCKLSQNTFLSTDVLRFTETFNTLNIFYRLWPQFTRPAQSNKSLAFPVGDAIAVHFFPNASFRAQRS